MKNLEKGNFENAWSRAFENARLTPSDKVWNRIEYGLGNVETQVMRKKVVFYQRIAAASILFALAYGAITTYLSTEVPTTTRNISRIETHQNNNNTNSNGIQSGFENNSIGSDRAVLSSTLQGDNTVNNNENNISTESKTLKRNNNLISAAVEKQNKSVSNPVANQILSFDSNRNDSPELTNRLASHPSLLNTIHEPDIKLNGDVHEVTIIRKLPAMPASFMATKDNKKREENLWAALNATTSSYSVVNSNVYSSPTALFQNQMTGSLQSSFSDVSSSKGTAYSVGMNIGKRISRKWVLLGGVSYMNQAMGYTTNLASLDPSNSNLRVSMDAYANKAISSSIVTVSNPYQINSVNEFISLPVQAGYLIVDRKIGFQFNSGIATDFFMQNTLTDKSKRLESYSSGAGEASPYKSVNWSGLMGSEVSYKLGDQYRVSLVPGLRYSFSSLLKSGYRASNPMVWDVGFRFRYIIN